MLDVRKALEGYLLSLPPPLYTMKRRNFNLKAHKEWRKALLERDKGCAVCGESEKMLASHHLIPECKKFAQYAKDVDNGIILCPTHHLWGIMSAHKNPFWFYLWMQSHRPEQLNIALNRMRQIVHEV